MTWKTGRIINLSTNQLYLDLRVAVDFLPQYLGTLKSDDLSRSQYQIVSRCRISPFPLTLFLYTEFSETTDKNIFTGAELAFHDFEKGLEQHDGFAFRVATLIVDAVN